MKRLFSILGLFLVMVSGIFAFDVLNSQGDVQEYFSMIDNDVNVVALSNESSLIVNFSVMDVSEVVWYNFSQCADKFCVNFALSDLIVDGNGTLASSPFFDLSVGNESRRVFWDIEKPVLQVESLDVLAVDRLILFDFNYSDDLSGIDKVELYKKSGNSLIFVDDVSNLTLYNYSIVSSGDFVFVFKVFDEAGNFEEVEKNVSVGDIFAPVISSSYVVKKEEKLELSFVVSDENLSKYEIVQGSMVLSEAINGSSFSKSINLPYDDGEIVLKVFDATGNSVNKTISLSSTIVNSYMGKFSNSKVFKFSSNAEMCVLSGVDSKSYDEEFAKQEGSFSEGLSINSVGEYLIKFYCERDSFREYFERAFYYDVNEPSESEVSVLALDDGSVKVDWNKSVDNESSVSYELYRNGKIVFEGSKLSFVDKDVEFPKNYKYFVKVVDEAGNSVDSEDVSVVPKKVNIVFESKVPVSSDVDFSEFDFVFETEDGVNVSVVLKNEDMVLQQINLTEIEQGDVEFKFNLTEGKNVILVKIFDEFGNVREESFVVNYEVPVLAIASEEDVVTSAQVVSSVYVGNDENFSGNESGVGVESVVEQNEEGSSFYDFVWYAVFVFVLLLFISFMFFGEDEGSLEQKRRDDKMKSRKKKESIFSVERFKDNKLEKDFDRIKRERIAKQQEIEREEEKRKKLAQREQGRYDMEKKKFEDLKKRDVFISFTQRMKAKRKFEKIQRDEGIAEELKLVSKKRERPIGGMSNNEGFGDYLSKVRSAPSWESNRAYVAKPEPKVESVVKEEIKKEEKPVVKKSSFSWFKKNEEVERIGNKVQEEKEEVVEKVEVRKEPSRKEVLGMDDYLGKRLKDKKRSLFFAEREVDNDLNER